MLADLDRDLQIAEDGDAGAGLVTRIPDIRVRDPTRVLASMAASGDVEDLGEVRELGVELHKFRGPLPAGDAGTLTATAWIDGDDLIRRLEIATAGGRATTTMTFYDFGAPVRVEPPPDGQVVLFRPERFGPRAPRAR